MEGKYSSFMIEADLGSLGIEVIYLRFCPLAPTTGREAP